MQVATKGDIRVLKTDIQGLEERVEKLDEKVDQKFDKVMTQLDGIAKGVDDLRIENAFGSDQIEELRKRVDKLESPQAA